MRNLTKADINILKSFFSSKYDINKYMNHNNLLNVIKYNEPNLYNALIQYKDSIHSINYILNRIDKNE